MTICGTTRNYVFGQLFDQPLELLFRLARAPEQKLAGRCPPREVCLATP